MPDLFDPNSKEELDSKFSAADTAIAAKQPLTGNSFAVAGVPAAASNVGRVIFVTNGAGGDPCAAISNGTSWLRITVGAAIAAA